ncbi:hypothetical protein CXB51_007047 [Gossypium anomalum]|uniref:Uncharacterized protein n=1 Tax=Gossypium anomalum TaxID=47600 RepID=A0A8J5YWI4_9ROSI|nr:hypothetical protein CXB51_007047 [Gossypium anomalum]
MCQTYYHICIIMSAYYLHILLTENLVNGLTTFIYVNTEISNLKYRDLESSNWRKD